jgi:outer membrane receptor protein involved in Fe transport
VFRQDDGRRWSWWLSYAYARAQDEIDGEWVPRSRDQPHTGSFSLNYSLSGKWNFNLAGLYHSGWPVTPIFANLEPGPDDGVIVVPFLGPRNRERYPDYLRFDLRASRVFHRGPGTWSLFLEVMNVLNRENLRGYGSLVDFEVEEDGSARLVPEYRSGIPLLPTLGIRWTF